MVVIPAYAYRMASFKKIVFVGEILALSAVLMCLLFVTVDLGRPERAWHLIPMIGMLNWPTSILSWDVVVLSGYLAINLVLVSLALRAKYYGKHPNPRIYVPLVFGSMVWAVSIHTVTAFLYTWLGARPYWNSPIIAPRFIASAFVSGPAFLVIALRQMQQQIGFPVDDEVYTTFRRIMTVTLLINFFLFLAEVFTELYGGSLHAASMRYMLFGHEQHTMMRVYIWLGIAMTLCSITILLTPLGRKMGWFQVACVGAFIGVWIEKGMALVVPGFIPTPLGEFTEYIPSVVETMVSLGIWSLGLLVFTVLVRIGARIERGELHAPDLKPAAEVEK
jgi:molybdopterin-containing oxidoreductase family membrane subunit